MATPFSMPPTGPADGILAALRAQFPGGAPPAAPAAPGMDPPALLKLFRDCYDDAFDQRAIYERIWWRNLLYTLGRHWIYYDRSRGQWNDKRLAKWIPRPVTNKVGEGVQAIRSIFQQVQLAALVRPAGRDPKHVATAETASTMAPLIHREHRLDALLAEHDFWLTVTGNCFLHPWWDKNAESGVEVVPFETCLACGLNATPAQIGTTGQCPRCQQQTFAPATDPATGQPMEKRMKVGRGRTDICSPLEVAVPSPTLDLADAPFLIRQRWRTKRWVEIHLPQMAKQVQWESSPTERSLLLFKSIAQQSELPAGPLFSGSDGGGGSTQTGISEYELWLRPTDTYPDGLVARFLGRASALVVQDDAQGLPGPLPYDTANGGKLFPWVHTSFDPFGGRFWARSPLDNAIGINDQLNQIDSLIQLIIQRVANPVWLEPKGAEVKSFTGEPGLVVKYQPLIAGGLAKPERLAGENVPPSLIQIREQKVADIEDALGTFEIMKGAKPPSVEAFSALQLLVERSQSRFGPVLAARGRTYADWFACAIELERQFGPTDRSGAVLGPNRSYTYQTFKNANLQGAITVIIEDGSQTPKTNLGKRAAIEQLNQLGMLDPTNPDQKYAVYQQFGVSDLAPGLDANVKSALQEQDAFETWALSPAADETQMAAYQQAQMMQQEAAMQADAMGQPVPPLPPFSPLVHEVWHEPAVHLAEHQKWANSDAVRQILADRPYLKDLITQHFIETQQALLATQMATQGGAPPESRGGQAMGNSNRESANPADVPRGNRETSQRRGPA
jgi:hypothetical protein